MSSSRYKNAIRALWYFGEVDESRLEDDVGQEQMRFLNKIMLLLSGASFDRTENIFAKGQQADHV
jgi:hypothetical protein